MPNYCGSYGGKVFAPFPTPSICLHLQDSGIQFGQAVWSARQSRRGISVSLFWSMCKVPKVMEKMAKKGMGEKEQWMSIHRVASASTLVLGDP